MFREFKAYLDDYSLITVEMPIEFDQKGMHFFLTLPEYGNTPLTVSGYETKESYINYYLIPHHELAIGQAYEVIDHRGNRSVLRMREIVRTVRFDEDYYYEKNDLGAVYEKAKTTLKLWAPTATEVYAVVSKANNTQVLPMNREIKGVYSAELDGDYEGYMYHYLTCLDGKWYQTIDPYARASSANGKDNYIVDTQKITKINSYLEKREPLNHFTDAIIYEIHIRDFTVQAEAGFRNRAKFTGMTENVEKNGETLGFDYLKNMGVTHVQILPFYDFGSVDELDQFQLYNWGYDPVQYNVPEGSYATKPNDPYARLVELKEMIAKFHQAGMRINMDVVYNHVYNHKTHAFEKTVPGYFFRHDHHGQMSNGTFCGNDIASERKMVRKYIVDSVRYWVEQFGVDGFRFDLMGILDIETMNEIRETLTQIDPTIMLYGEGWNMPTALAESEKAHMFNSKEIPKIGHFNDVFRDSLKGDTIRKGDNQQTGIVTGSHHFNKKIPDLLTASLGIYGQVNLFKNPEECINYVECHDNHTMWDFFQIEYPSGHTVMLQEIHRLATSLTLLSQGIAFLHGGQEFFRTKKGVENSYNVDDNINQFDWNRMIQYKENVEYIRGLISLRRLHGAFHFTDKSLIKKHCRIEMLPNGMTTYEIEQVGAYGPWENIFMAINTTAEMLRFEIDEPGWCVFANEQYAGVAAIKENVSKVYVAPYSIVLLAQPNVNEVITQ